MFDEYRKKLEDIGANSDKVFKKVAKQGANFFQKEAVRLTDQEKLVDTGTYKRNWTGEQAEIEGEQAIIGANPIEYASFLEEGHKLRNGKRWRGRFVGRRAFDETRYYCIKKLDDLFDKLFTQHHQSFTQSD
jgi:hypothetical protein